MFEKKETNMFWTKFFADKSGATAIEYGLIAALIAIVIIGAVTAFGPELNGALEAVEPPQ